eukprot:CAMPEP_0113312550 /NCGR_PEP_ID=MMETSP0010_2-20120614/9343_1 /TAXON_ID=216773 ORGANISM="Corethron hystrix, Strain 308" /NCGR_SAMPLE_ID=MMETSP0010_2 /ASSEMBLY_ACC=CAM_ASM_000155 /LENGTH=201 /DNA_ID=CAMNT_0000168413 /DNA_START=776 /DNA_END=1381 /DNA_ORIENTATION=+ /assembly_acc=CAM_ASM_000155
MQIAEGDGNLRPSNVKSTSQLHVVTKNNNLVTSSQVPGDSAVIRELLGKLKKKPGSSDDRYFFASSESAESFQSFSAESSGEIMMSSMGENCISSGENFTPKDSKGKLTLENSSSLFPSLSASNSFSSQATAGHSAQDSFDHIAPVSLVKSASHYFSSTSPLVVSAHSFVKSASSVLEDFVGAIPPANTQGLQTKEETKEK